MLAIAILLVGILSRLLFHIPNFTPVIALALFGGVYLSKRNALIVPIVLLAISDIIIGFHSTMFFTWSSVLLISAVGIYLKKRKNAYTVAGGSLVSAVLFFLVSNFGVWVVGGLYPLTSAGLAECFTRAVPYFRYTLISSVLYTAVIFGLYDLAAVKIKKTKFATFLL